MCVVGGWGGGGGVRESKVYYDFERYIDKSEQNVKLKIVKGIKKHGLNFD